MNKLKRRLQWNIAPLMLLVLEAFLPMSAHQQLESLTATAKGHGRISSAVDEWKITSALIVLRENGTFLIAVTADIQLQAEGTWTLSDSSPEEILLKITGGVLKGEMTGSGKPFLTSDRKSFKRFTFNVKPIDGREITVTFVADASKSRESV